MKVTYRKYPVEPETRPWQIKQFIAKHAEENDGLTPTYREISDATDIPLAAVHFYVKYLIDEGHLEWKTIMAPTRVLEVIPE